MNTGGSENDTHFGVGGGQPHFPPISTYLDHHKIANNSDVNMLYLL